jgi:hypothetical protein
VAKKKPSESALNNILAIAVEVLEDADDAGGDGMVTLSSSIYMRLRAAVKEATGVSHGIDADDESDEDEDEDDEDFDEDDS